jgi:4-hydroxy-tetrahydrodipicolinate synthase
MNANKFKGTGVALVTPFNQDQSIDFSALEKLVHHVSEQGVDYLVVLGTTGETPTLSFAEKEEVLKSVVKYNIKKLPIVLGIGGNNTKEIIHQFSAYDLSHVDAILSVSPYYNKPSQAGIIAHFKELDKFAPKPIILYNVPGRTGGNMTAETSILLANECKHVIAIKEASGNMVQSMELVKHRPDGFLILSGDDDLAMAQIALGFDGVISVAANCFTKLFTNMVNASLKHEFTKAQELNYQLLDGIGLLFIEGNPAGVKCVLTEMNICANQFRLPVVAVSEDTHQKIKKFVKSISALS